MKKIVLGVLLLLSIITIVGCEGTDTDATILERAKNSLNIGFQSGDSLNSVTKNLTLKDKDGNVTITWSSSDKTVVTDAGIVSRAETDKSVIMSATLNLNSESTTKTFTLTIKKIADTDTPDEPVIDIANLDLGGREISFYSHFADEDNPFSENYPENDQVEYQEFLTALQQEYNFTLKYVPFSDYTRRVQDISQHVSGGNSSAIVRIPETDVWLELVSNGYLANITDVSLELRDEYAINDWQVDAGTIRENVFAIQRNDGVKYVDLLVYNKTLLDRLGLEEDPIELWQRGAWTNQAFETMLRRIQQDINGVYPLGITPYHIAVYAPAANGAVSVNEDGSLAITRPEIFDTFTRYKSWFDAGYIRPLVNQEEYILKNSLGNIWANQEVVFGVGMMYQLEGYASSSNFEFSAVPFPQDANRTKDDYYTPLDSGDLLMVTKGSDSNEVAAIMYLMNEYHKNRLAAERKAEAIKYPALDDANLDAFLNVTKYLKLSNITDIQNATEVFSFLQGTSGYDSIRTNELAYLNGETDFVLAIQTYFQKGGTAMSSVQSVIPNIQEKIRKMLEAIANSK